MKAVTRLITYLALCATVALAHAEYPEKPIRIVVPFAAGSVSDSVARIIAHGLTERMGKVVLVDPRPGASGQLAAELVANAPADGYTLLITGNTTHSANPAMFKQLRYDPIKDFSPVLLLGDIPYVLVVDSGLPVKNLGQLISYIKANPGKTSYAYANSTSQVAGETFRMMSGIDTVSVPYKSSPQAMVDLQNNNVQFYFVDIPTGLAQIKAAKLRAIATAYKRTSLLPSIPAMTEELPGFALISWSGMLAPAKTPKTIVALLNKELRATMARQDVRDQLEKIGFEISATGTPEDFGVLLQSELVKWAKWVKDAGIQPE